MSKFRSQRLAARALLAGASSVLFAVSAFGQAAPTDSSAAAKKSDENEPQKLEKFEITGSRIRRLDAETVSPVTTVRTADLAVTGFPTIAEAIRAMPFNSGQALSPTDSNNSFTPGVNSFNLRGLGNNNTLVLINGRRAVPYASPGFDGFQTVFDLNSIPDAAIESMEILKDGGSALYGSDAVAGVIDFKLRRDYQGAFTSFEVGNYFKTDGMEKKASFVVGNVSAKTSILVAASYQKNEAVFARDLYYSKNGDQSYRAAGARPEYRVPVTDPRGGYTTVKEGLENFGFTDPVSDGWFDNRSGSGFPGYIGIDFNGNGSISSSERRTYTSPTSQPTTAGATTSLNYYNFQDVAGLFPEVQRYSFFSTMRHELTDHLYAFAELSFSRVESINEAAPAPASLASEQGLTQGSHMYIPAYNPYNPWARDITSGARRLVEAGNRINDVTADTPRILVGLGGDVPQAGLFEDWTWQSGLMYSKNTVTNLNPGSVPDYKLQQALMGLTRLGDGSLTWNPNTAQDKREYFNWFGYNDKAFGDFLTVENPNVDSLLYQNIDISANGTLFDLPGGRVGLAIGAEHRSEKLSSIATELNATSMIVGGSSGTSSYGDRRVTSIYAETNLPVQKWLEFQIAGRFEKYSDEGFEQKVRPKVGFKLRPLDWLILRGSYSESFKAPDLAYLYTNSTTTFTSNQYNDPVTNVKDQLQIRVAGNPDLKPESTDVYYTGITIEPNKGMFKGFSASFDYFIFDQSNLLAQLTDFYAYSDFLAQAALGDPLFAPKVVRDPNTKALLYINDDYSNISKARYQGYDFELAYRWTTNSYGQFRTSLAGTYLDQYVVDGDNIAGSLLNARLNMTAAVNWQYRDWGVNLYAVYRGKRETDIYTGYTLTDEDDALDAVYIHYRVAPQYTFNVNVSYAALWGTKVIVGVNNVLDTQPPSDPMEASGSTPGVNYHEPAFWYVRLEKSF